MSPCDLSFQHSCSRVNNSAAVFAQVGEGSCDEILTAFLFSVKMVVIIVDAVGR